MQPEWSSHSCPWQHVFAQNGQLKLHYAPRTAATILNKCHSSIVRAMVTLSRVKLRIQAAAAGAPPIKTYIWEQWTSTVNGRRLVSVCCRRSFPAVFRLHIFHHNWISELNCNHSRVFAIHLAVQSLESEKQWAESQKNSELKVWRKETNDDKSKQNTSCQDTVHCSADSEDGIRAWWPHASTMAWGLSNRCTDITSHWTLVEWYQWKLSTWPSSRCFTFALFLPSKVFLPARIWSAKSLRIGKVYDDICGLYTADGIWIWALKTLPVSHIKKFARTET